MQEKDFLINIFMNFLSSITAKNIFKQHSFFTIAQELQIDLAISQEIYQFTQKYHSVYFLELPDIRHNISLSQKDYILNISDIYTVYQTLWQWQQIQAIEIDSNDFSQLYNIVYQKVFPTHLLSHWKSVFSDTGELLDTASPELKRIRTLKKNLRTQIEKQLHKQIHQNEDLAEKRIAFREDRYVLPIKSIAKNRTHGIVHGFSKTGSITFIEPVEIVHLNNELLSVDDLEHQEINRLLRLWSKIVSTHCEDILFFINQSAKLEIFFAKANFAHQYHCNFGILNTNNQIILKEVYNPFLLIKKGKEHTIPISLRLENNKKGIIISGPNAGGKSAALKTLALCAEMFLLGLPIPAEEITFPFFTKILFEFGDSQSLEDELSTFSGHLYNIKSILQKCNSSTLVLIDEIAHATDPLEGEALACSIIDFLIFSNTFFAITTHYRKVKIKAFEHNHITIYSTGFNLETLQPLYSLYPNTIGESYALQIATKVGLPTQLIQRAELLLKENNDKTEEILANIEKFEKQLRAKEFALQEQKQEYLTQLEKIHNQQQALHNEKQQLQHKGLEIADKELNHCLRELSSIQKELAKNPKQTSKKLQKINNQLSQKKSEITKLSYQNKTHFIKGEIVFIASLGRKGIIEEISTDTIFVRIGILKFSVKKSDIFEIPHTRHISTKPIIKKFVNNPKSSIDVHGLTGDEAINQLEKYLYPALVSGLNEFSVIHGKGAGILQKRIHQYLKNVPEVKKFSFATPHNGGTGKTIIYFV